MKKSELLSQIESLIKQLVVKYAPEKVILFGSAVREGEQEVNDIDLFIIKDAVPHLGAERIRQLYRLMDINLPVDYLVYRPEEVAKRLALGDPFIAYIFKEGKVLYG